MGFNELNSVEHYIVHQLNGVNLNNIEVQNSKPTYGAQWEYKTSDETRRGVNEVLIESELKEALIRLNPEIPSNPDLAGQAGLTDHIRLKLLLPCTMLKFYKLDWSAKIGLGWSI